MPKSVLSLEGGQSLVIQPKPVALGLASTVWLHTMSMNGLTFSHSVPLGSPAAYTETGLASLLEDLKEVKASIQA